MPPLGNSRGHEIIAEVLSARANEPEHTTFQTWGEEWNEEEAVPNEAQSLWYPAMATGPQRASPETETAQNIQWSLTREDIVPIAPPHSAAGDDAEHSQESPVASSSFDARPLSMNATPNGHPVVLDHSADAARVQASPHPDGSLASVAEQSFIEASELGTTKRSVHIASSGGKRILGSSDNMARDIDELASRTGGDDLKRMLRVAYRIGNAKDTKLVPRASVINYLKDTIQRNGECIQIPFAILYVLLFSLMLLAHEQTVDLSQVEREFRGMVEGTTFEGLSPDGPVFDSLPVSGHKAMDDIDVVDDVYTYLQDALLPLFVQNNALPEDRFRVLSYNQLLGGFQLRQVRKTEIPCEEAYPTLGPFNEAGKNPFLKNFTCYPIWSTSRGCYGPGVDMEGFCPDNMRTFAKRRLLVDPSLLPSAAKGASGGCRDASGHMSPHRKGRRSSAAGDRGGAGRRLTDTTPVSNSRRLSASAHAVRNKIGRKSRKITAGPASGDEFTVVMHEFEGLQVAYQKLKALKENDWIDFQTSYVTIYLSVLNPDLGVFCSTRVEIYFAPSGEIVPFVTSTSFTSEPYAYKYILVLDGIWALLWFQLGFRRLFTLCRACSSGKRRVYFIDPWNWVEWLSFVGGGVVIHMWIEYLFLLMEFKAKALDLVVARPTASNASAAVKDEYYRTMFDLYPASEALEDHLETARVYYGWYTMFLILRFFKAFEAQPRLKVVTQTIVESKNDLIHFGIVMMTMFFSFMCASMLLFGHRLVQFSSMTYATYDCLQILVGNFRYDELAEESPLTATMWITSFLFLMTLIMVNMILAIIMDVYGAAKQSAASSDAIWEQLQIMITETINRARQMPLAEVLKVVERLPFEYVGASVLMDSCPSMQSSQAVDLIEKIEAAERNEDECNLTLSDATRLIYAIQKDVTRLAEKITEIYEVQKLGKMDDEEQVKLQRILGSAYIPQHPSFMWLDEKAETTIRSLESRLTKLEEFMNEAMSYAVFRGKDMKTRLTALEELLRGQRNTMGDTGFDMQTNRRPNTMPPY
mmetsp:Transcript_53618/g.149169  ORF Transcript_53618/g.149169 Transcript_53618/m.149169 type:complete len:1038 (+) Transcript_53618:78-3191(+)